MKRLTNFELKMIALFFMTIDHIGYFIFPQYIIFRIFGRLSFPVFAFLIGEGFKYTSNRIRFITTLYGFGLLLYFVIPFPNIFITLGIATAIMFVFSKDLIVKFPVLNNIPFTIMPFVQVALAILISLSLKVVDGDYGLYGVILIILIYIINISKTNLITKCALYVSSYYVLTSVFYSTYSIQMYGIFAIFIIALYNGKLGFRNKFSKYVFYVYYPLHIGVLYLIGTYLFYN